VRPADCHVSQRVLYAGRAYVVSALAGDRAVIADGGEFRTVPISELEPALLRNGQLEAAIRDHGADAEPGPDWQAKVWRGIEGEPRRRLARLWPIATLALVTAAIAAWLVLA